MCVSVSAHVLYVRKCMYTYIHMCIFLYLHAFLSDRPEQMTTKVWDYVFLGGDLPSTDIAPNVLRYMCLLI